MKIDECQGIITLRDVRKTIAKYGLDSLEKKVGSVMTRKLITIDPNSTTSEAGRLMDEKAIDHLPVVNEKGVIEGIISAKDLIFSLGGIPVKDAMTKQIVTVPPALPIVDAVKIMDRKNIASLLIKS